MDNTEQNPPEQNSWWWGGIDKYGKTVVYNPDPDTASPDSPRGIAHSVLDRPIREVFGLQLPITVHVRSVAAAAAGFMVFVVLYAALGSRLGSGWEPIFGMLGMVLAIAAFMASEVPYTRSGDAGAALKSQATYRVVPDCVVTTSHWRTLIRQAMSGGPGSAVHHSLWEAANLSVTLRGELTAESRRELESLVRQAGQ